MFLEYSEYMNMGGTVDVDTFRALERKARNYINLVTHNRIRDETEVRDSVKEACFDLIGVISQAESSASSLNAGIQSEHNDGVSVTYRNSDDVVRDQRRAMNRALVMTLTDELDADGVPLLYGGVDE